MRVPQWESVALKTSARDQALWWAGSSAKRYRSQLTPCRLRAARHAWILASVSPAPSRTGCSTARSARGPPSAAHSSRQAAAWS